MASEAMKKRARGWMEVRLNRESNWVADARFMRAQAFQNCNYPERFQQSR